MQQIRHLEDERDQEASDSDDAIDYEEAYGLRGDIDDGSEPQSAVVPGVATRDAVAVEPVADEVVAAKPVVEEGETVKVKLSVDDEDDAPVALRLEALDSDDLRKSPSSIADVYFFGK